MLGRWNDWSNPIKNEIRESHVSLNNLRLLRNSLVNTFVSSIFSITSTQRHANVKRKPTINSRHWRVNNPPEFPRCLCDSRQSSRLFRRQIWTHRLPSWGRKPEISTLMARSSNRALGSSSSWRSILVDSYSKTPSPSSPRQRSKM